MLNQWWAVGWLGEGVGNPLLHLCGCNAGRSAAFGGDRIGAGGKPKRLVVPGVEFDGV